MPSKDYIKNITVFHKYQLSQLKTKKYSGKSVGECYLLILKDARKYYSESKAFKKTLEQRKAMISDINSYDRAFRKKIRESSLALNSVTYDQFIEVHDDIMSTKKSEDKSLKIKQGKCSIDDTDKILFGDGGSTSIIVITKDKRAYKFFTLYFFTPDIESGKEIENKTKSVANEIKIFKLLTENIINTNVSHHIVKYIEKSKCSDARSLFSKCPKTYTEFLKLPDEQKTKMCSQLFKQYPQKQLNDDYSVVEIEYCDYSCADFVRDVSKLPEIEMERYLDIFFFQIIYTIVSIQGVFPYFTHNDLFIRNILGQKEKDNGNYYTYKFDGKTYFVPQKKFYPKINDFGMTNLNDEHKDIQLYKSEYKDIYNIIFDVYDGGNLGSKSLSNLCKDDPDKLKFLKSYFSAYFNTGVVDDYKSKSSRQMNWDWSAILDEDFLRSIEMKRPTDLLQNYFYSIFSKINENVLHR